MARNRYMDDESDVKKISFGLLKRLFKYTLPYKNNFLAGLGLITINVLISLIWGKMVQWLVDEVLNVNGKFAFSITTLLTVVGTVSLILFIDTFIVLTINALVIISTLYTPDGPLFECGAAAASTVITKTNLAQTAFGTVLGAKFGAIFVAICLFFFAFSTILSWNMFGKINAIWLFGRKNPKAAESVYMIIAIAFVFMGTMMSNDLVWELTDAFNYLMVLPNVIALFAMTKVVADSVKEIDSKK